MSVRVSVVVPFFNAEPMLAHCLAALAGQSFAKGDYEVIAVDDGSTDDGAAVAARCGVRLVQQENRGAAAARNAGIRVATGRWVAFTDADCIPSRAWLARLVAAAEQADPDALGAAGATIGFQSETPAARYVDLAGGLDAERHLAHARFPFAPSANVMYRRDALERVGGFDERYGAYDACDLHTRLRRSAGGAFPFEPSAVVLHRHRTTWSGYWRQQRGYGRGLAQFYLRHREEVPWSAWREARGWAALLPVAASALVFRRGDQGLVRRGKLVKDLAQRLGFATCYFSSRERRRWREPR